MIKSDEESPEETTVEKKDEAVKIKIETNSDSTISDQEYCDTAIACELPIDKWDKKALSKL